VRLLPTFGDVAAQNRFDSAVLFAAVSAVLIVPSVGVAALTSGGEATPASLVSVGAAAAAVVAVAARLFGGWGLRRVLGAVPLDPDAGPEERQLAAIAGELCLAAGLPAPALLLIESPFPNAAAFGYSPARASIAVTRGLLAIGREETSAVIAYQVARISNLEIRYSTLISALIGMPAIVSRLLTGAGSTSRVRPAFSSLGLVATFTLSLCVGVGMLSAPLLVTGNPLSFAVGLGLMAPMLVAVGYPASLIAAGLLSPLLIGRGRYFLADAGAVELTRDPIALERALAAVGAAGGLITGDPFAPSTYVAHFFFADGVEAGRLGRPGLVERINRVRALRGAPPAERA
jgi:heat shock protein HtpX